MGRHRIAAALLVPQPLATELDGLRRALGAGERERVAPHLTLLSPVNLRDADLRAALDRLRVAAASLDGPLRLSLGPATTFAPVTPTVHLAVGGPGLDALLGLRAALTAAPPLDRPEAHEYVPHVTLAQGLEPPSRVEAAVAALGGWRHEVTFDRAHLLAQQPSKAWAPIADAPFGPPGVVGRGGVELSLTVTARPEPAAAALLAVDGAGGGGGRPWAVTARLDDQVAGAAWGWTSGAVLTIADLAVAAAHRNLGIGRRLLAAVESLAADRNATTLHATAPEGPATSLLEGAGWTRVDDHLWRRRLPPA